jgi:hypothetical protein
MKRSLILMAAVTAAGLALADPPVINGNSVGLVEVTVPTTGSKILSVPFEKPLGTTPGQAGVLSELIATNDLKGASVGSEADADKIVVLTQANVGGNMTNVYYYYWYQTDVGWTPYQTKVLGGPVEGSITPPTANTFELARGKGFWLVRPTGATGNKLYVTGQIPTNSAAVTLKGNNTFTLIGFGALNDRDINDDEVTWASRYDGGGLGQDQLRLVSDEGVMSTYTYWGGDDNQWLTPAGTTNTVAIKPGEGFWYLRRDTLDTTFTPVVIPAQ